MVRLNTSTVIAQKLGVPPWRVEYILRTRPHIRPAALKSLEAAGLLVVMRQGPGQVTQYTIDSSKRYPTSSATLQVALPEKAQGATPEVVEALPQRAHNQTKRTKPKNQTKTRGVCDPWKSALEVMRGDGLQTERFQQAWREWLDYRKQLKKPMTPATIKRQIHDLEAVGEQAAIGMIEQSIRNGWTGLFPEKEKTNGNLNGRMQTPNPGRLQSPPGKYDRFRGQG